MILPSDHRVMHLHQVLISVLVIFFFLCIVNKFQYASKTEFVQIKESDVDTL